MVALSSFFLKYAAYDDDDDDDDDDVEDVLSNVFMLNDFRDYSPKDTSET